MASFAGKDEKMNCFLNRYCKVLEMITAVLMVGMVILVFGNVVLRYFFYYRRADCRGAVAVDVCVDGVHRRHRRD